MPSARPHVTIRAGVERYKPPLAGSPRLRSGEGSVRDRSPGAWAGQRQGQAPPSRPPRPPVDLLRPSPWAPICICRGVRAVRLVTAAGVQSDEKAKSLEAVLEQRRRLKKGGGARRVGPAPPPGATPAPPGCPVPLAAAPLTCLSRLGRAAPPGAAASGCGGRRGARAAAGTRTRRRAARRGDAAARRRRPAELRAPGAPRERPRPQVCSHLLRCAARGAPIAHGTRAGHRRAGAAGAAGLASALGGPPTKTLICGRAAAPRLRARQLPAPRPPREKPRALSRTASHSRSAPPVCATTTEARACSSPGCACGSRRRAPPEPRRGEASRRLGHVTDGGAAPRRATPRCTASGRDEAGGAAARDARVGEQQRRRGSGGAERRRRSGARKRRLVGRSRK